MVPAVAYVLRQNCYVLVIIERRDEKSLDSGCPLLLRLCFSLPKHLALYSGRFA